MKSDQNSSKKKVAIIQSNYIPWRGYFDFIAKVDEFILFDDVQYTKRDWRNRNQIKTAQGLKWLTIPVEVKGKYLQNVNETRVSDSTWAKKHLSSLKHAYAQSPYFDFLYQEITTVYDQISNYYLLSEINEALIRFLANKLAIATTIKSSSDYGVVSGKNERLIDLCLKAQADTYVSGPAAKGYLDEKMFNSHGIDVDWMDYSGYLDYPQIHGVFSPNVSILDLFFNVGPNARSYLKFV